MNIKSYVTRPMETLRRKQGAAPTPILLGSEMGDQERSVVLARQALPLDGVVFSEHLWTPHGGLKHHTGNMHPLCECIARKEESHLLCPAARE